MNECDSPGRKGEDIGALDFSAAQQNLGQDLVLQQQHGLAALANVPPLLDGVGHVLVPPAVVVQRAVPVCSAHTKTRLTVPLCMKKQLEKHYTT